MFIKTLFDFNQARTQKFSVVFFLIVTAAVSLRMLAFIQEYSVNVYFWDEWDYLDEMFFNKGYIAEFLRIHGPHRMGLGYWVIDILAKITDWNSRANSYAVFAVYFFTNFFAWELKVKITRRAEYWDSLIPLFVLSLAYYESLVIVPNVSLNALPVLFLFLYARALLVDNVGIQVILLLILDLLATYTGFGLFVGYLTPLVIAFLYLKTRHLPDRPIQVTKFYALAFILSLGIIGSFYWNYILYSASDCYKFPHDRPLEYLYFIGAGLGNFFSLRGGYLVLFEAYLVVILGTMYLRFASQFVRSAWEGKERSHANLSIAFLVTYCLLFLFLSSLGRVCTGWEEAARAPRYTAYMIPLFVGVLIWFSRQKSKWHKLGIFGLIFFAILGEYFFHFHAIQDVKKYSNIQRVWADTYRETKSIEEANRRAGHPIFPSPEATKLQEKLDFLERNQLNLFSK